MKWYEYTLTLIRSLTFPILFNKLIWIEIVLAFESQLPTFIYNSYTLSGPASLTPNSLAGL
jgi:hypothetical protein